MSRRRDERGSASVELAGMVPALLVALLAVLQLGAAGWTAVEAEHAARGAARAASLGQDPHAAAAQALPGGLHAESVTGGRTGQGERWTVRVAVPSLMNLRVGSVSRTVEMPALR